MLLSVILLSVYATEQAYFSQKDFISQINEEATTWKAGVNFDPNMLKEHFLKLLGSKGEEIPNKINHKMYKVDDKAYDKLSRRIPRQFDASEKWRNCKTIGEVRDKENCGWCWAMATSSAFADRLCVATNGDFNNFLSDVEITFCCHTCGFGCYGGYPIRAWKHIKTHGLVTGGNYKSEEGCEPYRVPPCPYDEEGNNTCADQPMESNHRCTTTCYRDQDLDYDQDHRYTRNYYHLTYGSIQKDVMTYGPIEASFDVYDDFPSDESGAYERSENASYLVGHAVKLIGCGEEYGVPYWLMMNSWNEDLGDQGLFKIRRGTNECGVDNSTIAGVPTNKLSVHSNVKTNSTMHDIENCERKFGMSHVCKTEITHAGSMSS
ncbi:cathepsin B-like cysteine proteinase [Rhopalosiphum maidis]|uniref:cathepsin B-like cysteine proteinase n=1 Tax=Rhopalosiphum maidis TaxID=43146 RepID=UPI000EFFD076|nr:cathepsin B-like cysteine proteinase [Rhopalosiphum maidis]